MVMYAIVERDKDGNVTYLPPLATNEAPGMVYRMTPDVTKAREFAENQAAEDMPTCLPRRIPVHTFRSLNCP